MSEPRYTEKQVRDLIEQCAVLAWSTGLDLSLKKRLEEPREVGAECAGRIREEADRLLSRYRKQS